MADTPERKTLSLKAGAPRDADTPRESVRTGSRAHRAARDRHTPSAAAPDKPADRSRPPRDDKDRGPRGPRPEGGFRPRGDDNRGPRGPRPEGGFRPRDDDNRGPRGPRPEGGFRPRGDDDRGPRGPRPEGGFRPRDDDNRGPRGPRPEGGFRPRDDDNRGPRGPRPEGGFRPRGDDDRGPRGPRPEGGFRPRGDDDRGPRGPRPEGGFRPRGDDNRGPRGPRPEGGFRPRDDDNRGPRGPRPEGGFRPRGDDSRAPRRDAPGARPAPARELAPDGVHAVFASCPQGLEAALADELKQLGVTDVVPGRSGVRFRANWRDVMRANLHSRLAGRILVQVAYGPVATEDDLLRLAYDTPWERWFGAEQTLRVDTSAIRSPMQSLQYCNLRAKDGICDRLRDREGERPDIDTVRPDARVHVFLDETSATLYLDTSGESLFKRGWRFDKGEAPLRENLAAGLLALSGWTPDLPLIDPFCGSGTILIEAAFIALRVPPGMTRPFSFERLRNFDEAGWRAIKAEAQEQILATLDVPLVGSDIDPRAIEAARLNAERARLSPDAITFTVAQARDMRPPSDVPGFIVTNPPYGERLETGEDNTLWDEWASTLKGHFDGWQAHVITTDRDLPRHLRLNANRRTPLYNGALECRLFAFEIVGGSYRQKL